jgi:hypothetical protein
VDERERAGRWLTARQVFRARVRRVFGAASLWALVSVPPLQAQTPARMSVDSAIAIDHFVGENTVDRPNIVVDVTATVRLGSGWSAYVRPWFRQPRNDTWDKQIYQAALQHERAGRISTRTDLGYIVSPIGIGMMDTRPGINPLILPHLSYVTPMPAFDPGAPRVQAIAATYPLGAQFTASTLRWDARAALTATPPNRIFLINMATAVPKAGPYTVVGAGITPRIGLRIGGTIGTGEYVAADEFTRTTASARSSQIMSLEGEYAVGYSKLTGEVTRNRLDTNASPAVAYAWFIQGVQTVAPRWFVAARQEGVSAPPLQTAVATGARSIFHVTEATVGYRLSTELTLRASVAARKPFPRSDWDEQFGASLVWAHRWY